MGQKVTLVSAVSVPVKSTTSRRDRGRFASGEIRQASLDRIMPAGSASACESSTETVGVDGSFQSCL